MKVNLTQHVLQVLMSITVVVFSFFAQAYDANAVKPQVSDAAPKELNGVGIKEHLGSKIDLNLEFQDEQAKTVTLGSFFNSGRPVMMAMVYYDCPHLCNYQLNGLIDVVKKMKGTAGIDYEVVAVSMDATETPDLAIKKKQNYMKALGQPEAEGGWHFLVGSTKNVQSLADQLGFSFRWDENLKEFAHAAATYILTPDGRLSRYMYGIEFAQQTLRLSLVEASEGKIGSFVEKIALFCFQFDPTKNKYTLYSFNLMRIAGALTVFLIGLFLIPVWMREKRLARRA
jgi:protein SCO1/2